MIYRFIFVLLVYYDIVVTFGLNNPDNFIDLNFDCQLLGWRFWVLWIRYFSMTVVNVFI
jgi:hypothetical protein